MNTKMGRFCSSKVNICVFLWFEENEIDTSEIEMISLLNEKVYKETKSCKIDYDFGYFFRHK